MTPQAYLYICDGDIDNPVLTHKKMDWPEKYPHWQEIPLVMAQPEQEPQYAGTARELFTNAAIERLDVRPSTKVYLGTPSVCEQHQDWCASLTQMLASMPPKPAPCNCKPEPVIDKSAAVRIATALGWEPKRTWVGLTDEEIRRIELTVHGYRRQPLDVKAFARAIEAKLKEKNT